jgi:hypothetical protein
MFGLILQFIIWLRHLTHRAIKNSPYFYSDLFISPSTTPKGLNHFLPPVFSAGPYTSFTFRGFAYDSFFAKDNIDFFFFFPFDFPSS